MVDIMKKKIILSVCIAVAMAFSLPSQAQRLMIGTKWLKYLLLYGSALCHLLIYNLKGWKSHSTLTPLGKQNCSLWP